VAALFACNKVLYLCINCAPFILDVRAPKGFGVHDSRWSNRDDHWVATVPADL
jgi:hypothetical protein